MAATVKEYARARAGRNRKAPEDDVPALFRFCRLSRIARGFGGAKS
jgi:hypothetical protein